MNSGIIYKIADETLRWLLVTGLMVWILSCLIAEMFYHPDAIEYLPISAMRSPARDEYFNSEDGTKLHGWFVPSSQSNAAGTVVHFHGNAQNLTAHASFVDWMPAEGYNLFLFDYRGYGKSEGKPSRKGLYQDGVAALRYVRTLPEVDTNRIVIIGQSLGGTTALAVVGRHPELAGRGLIIDSSFYSYRHIVRDKIALIPILSLVRVPLSWLVISDAYSPAPVLHNISPTPVLYLHGTADQVIPPHHTDLLFEHTAEPKQKLILENGQHISAFSSHREEAIPVVLDFIERALTNAATKAINP